LIFRNISILHAAIDARVRPEHDAERTTTRHNENRGGSRFAAKLAAGRRKTLHCSSGIGGEPAVRIGLRRPKQDKNGQLQVRKQPFSVKTAPAASVFFTLRATCLPRASFNEL
jgi:hypothetical protein